MDKLFSLSILFLAALALAVSASAVDIEINAKDSFYPGDFIEFNYTVVSDTPLEVAYMAYVVCPSAPRAIVEQKTAFLNSSVQLRESHEDLLVSLDIEPQTCTAYVQILSPVQKITSKEFEIITDPSFDFRLLFCKDPSCSEQTKVFTMDELPRISFESEIENPEITATLTYPDNSSEQITLPTSISPTQVGTYGLEVTVSKAGYKSQTVKEMFGVIEKHVDIEAADFSVSGADNTVPDFMESVSDQVTEGDTDKTVRASTGVEISDNTPYILIAILFITAVIVLVYLKKFRK